MTDLSDREEPLGDRVKMLELVVAHLGDRTADIERLSVATTRLSESTEGLDSALREVGKIRDRQDDLAETVEQVSAAAPNADAMVPRRWFWAVVTCLALAIAFVIYGAWDRHQIRQQVANEHRTICRLAAEMSQSCDHR